MDRTERFYKSSELLRASKVVSFATLLGKLEVSRSTLKRDLNYLSTRLNNPIVYCRELGGYRLEVSDTSGQQAHELPGLWFSPTEIHALLTMQQLVAGLDAITQVIPLEKAAPEVSDAKLSATFGPGYGIFSGGAVRWARLRFSPECARWVAQEQWHPEQTGQHEPDDSYLLRLPYTDHGELIMDILNHGTHCEVLGPANLRRVVGEEAAKMVENG